MGRWLDEYRALHAVEAPGSGEPRSVAPEGTSLRGAPSPDPESPALASGWTVAYQDSRGKLRCGVVASHSGSQVRLVSGETVAVRCIVSVTDGVGAWLVRYHGLVPTDRQPRPDWLAAWRELAILTLGIARGDHRYLLLIAAFDQCDESFLAGDWKSFKKAAETIRMIAKV